MRKVYGVGINDAGYVVQPTLGGIRAVCPYYNAWQHMLARCYSKVQQRKRPSYTGCSVVPEWHRFSEFKAWMEQQDWEGKELDKDILIPENKIYGPETCLFVEPLVNTFILDRAGDRGDYPLGVAWHAQRSKFVARISNPFTKKNQYLGLFDCPNEAHKAWLDAKIKLAELLSEEQDDLRVKSALVTRYQKLKELL